MVHNEDLGKMHSYCHGVYCPVFKFRSQLRLPVVAVDWLLGPTGREIFFGTVELVTSVMIVGVVEEAAAGILLIPSVDGSLARTGVNPVRGVTTFLRARGVTFSLLLGALSGVKT